MRQWPWGCDYQGAGRDAAAGGVALEHGVPALHTPRVSGLGKRAATAGGDHSSLGTLASSNSWDSSPDLYISVTMSHPPTNSPST